MWRSLHSVFVRARVCMHLYPQEYRDQPETFEVPDMNFGQGGELLPHFDMPQV